MAKAENDDLPKAEYQGSLSIGDIEIDCYVLEDGRRVIHKRGMAKGLGMKSEGGNVFGRTIERLGSKISQKVRDRVANPIVFKPLTGDPAHGYDSEFVIELCEAIVDAPDLHPKQRPLARQAEIIIRAAARVGIAALIDEATGYIKDKKKDEYRQLFQDFIRERFREWEREFPPQFFEMLYRVYNIRRSPEARNHPRFFGRFIRRYIYSPLADSQGMLLEILDEKNPVVYSNGGRRHKMHQFLTDIVGLPALRAHLWQVVGIGNSVANKIQFDRAFSRAFPGNERQLELPGMEE